MQQKYCQKYHLKFDIITEETYPIFTQQINNFVMHLFKTNALKFTNEKSKIKFLKSRKYYERSNCSNQSS